MDLPAGPSIREPGRAYCKGPGAAGRRANGIEVNDRASPGRGGRSQAGERPAAGRECAAVQRDPGGAGAADRVVGDPARHRQHDDDAEHSLQQIAETTARLFGASSVTHPHRPGRRMEPDDQRRSQRETHQHGGFGNPIAARCAGTCRARSSRENRQSTFPTSTIPIPRLPTGPVSAARPPAPASLSGMPLRREGRRSVSSSFIATGRCPSQPRNSRCSRASPTRPSSRSRTRGCSTRPSRRWPGRPRPPTSCGSSASRRPTCSRCSTPSC